jgi:DNA-directed RNA polymerase specialized sigma24 family protein
VTTTTADCGSDEQLLDAVAAGDRHALRSLYERHAPWLVLRLSRRCSNPAVVDQAVQDTFLSVWRKPGSYRGDGAVAAWLWGIGVRRLIDQLRRRPAATWTIVPSPACRTYLQQGVPNEHRIARDADHIPQPVALSRVFTAVDTRRPQPVAVPDSRRLPPTRSTRGPGRPTATSFSGPLGRPRTSGAGR